jgi:short-subunit dehydrogenase
MVNQQRPTAVVTGASAGIGRAFAERLAGDGYDVVLVARRLERLEDIARRLEAQHGSRASVLAVDLTDPAQLRSVEQAIAADPAVELLVNNAGFGGYMPFVELPPERAEELIRLHVLATTRLTRAALPGMIERRRGAIINVSSLLSFSASLPSPPLPQRAVYAAAKAYINTFSEIVASELKDSGVQVQVLCPGLVHTEFHAVAGRDLSAVPAMSAEDLVAASLAGLRLGEVVCVPALGDQSLLSAVAESRTAMMGAARTPDVAARYRDGAG